MESFHRMDNVSPTSEDLHILRLQLIDPAADSMGIYGIRFNAGSAPQDLNVVE